MTMMNKTELCAALGKSQNTIDRWVTLGCPVAERSTGRGQGWKFDSAAVVDWFVRWKIDQQQGNAVTADMEELRRRKLQAETTLIEAELREKLRRLAPVAHMRAAMNIFAAMTRERMRQLPSRIAPQLIGETDERRFKQIMGDEIDQALTDAAQCSEDEFSTRLEAGINDEFEDEEKNET